MKIEVILPQHSQKQILHITDSEIKTIPVNPSVKNSVYPEFLAYAQKYVAENGFKLLNVDESKLFIYKG